MKKYVLFISILLFTNECFASPFDIINDENHISESIFLNDNDSYIMNSKKIDDVDDQNHSNDDLDDDAYSSTNKQNSIIAVANDEESEYENYSRHNINIVKFHDYNKANITLLNIKNGKKQSFDIQVNDLITIDSLKFKLNSCKIENSTFYNKLSIAKITINDANYEITNDLNLLRQTFNHYLITINCHNT